MHAQRAQTQTVIASNPARVMANNRKLSSVAAVAAAWEVHVVRHPASN